MVFPALTRANENGNLKPLKEKIFQNITWEMNVDAFKKSYSRSDNLVKVPVNDDSTDF
jgi:hypothetical protein